MAEFRAEDDPDRGTAQGATPAFEEIFRRYHNRLVAFFARRGLGIEICRELTQDTFLRVYRNMKSFRGEVPLASWVFQIAANVYRNELRRRHAGKREGWEIPLDGPAEADPEDASPTEPASGEADALATTLGREQVEAVRRALSELPPQMRRAMQMRVHHGYSVAEIATLMKISESTVKVHLHQARKRLRQTLADRFGELPF